MKINRIDGAGGAREAGGVSKPQGQAQSSKAGPADAPSGDRVEVSDAARRAARLAAAVNAMPEIRADRVDALRDEIAAGEYQPEPRDVARSIVEFEREFIR